MSQVKFTTISNLAGTKSLTTDQIIDRASCVAWIKATVAGGVPSISASFNITSITDDSVGLFRINFTNAMPDANYCQQVSMGGNSDPSNYFGAITNSNSYAATTSYATICTKFGGSPYDVGNWACAIFR